MAIDQNDFTKVAGLFTPTSIIGQPLTAVHIDDTHIDHDSPNQGVGGA